MMSGRSAVRRESDGGRRDESVQRARNFSSQSADYPQAFAVFLANTDQKRNAKAWLDRRIAGLASRRVFIDAGAGNGTLTAQLAPEFERTIAVEPNPSLVRELRAACPSAEILPTPIDAANPPAEADFVLCSHVLYYVSRTEWMDVLRTLASWLSPQGQAVVVLQNAGTDCMTMLRNFTGHSFQLGPLADDFAAESIGRFSVEVETVPAHIKTASLQEATTIAEFMLNLAPPDPMPWLTDVERYVDEHFRRPDGVWRFSCHQDCLIIRPTTSKV
jgi:SAM-dependent methyltransferase